jgi:transcription antitermination factor NusG
VLLSDVSASQWYAVRVKPNCEKRVGQQLQYRDYDQYVPTYRLKRKWSDRNKVLDVPLLPGYVFCRLLIENRLPVLMTPGVLSFVGLGRQPVPIPFEQIDAVRRVAESDLCCGPCAYVGVGDVVRVEHGPLAGLEGIVTRLRGKDRLVVSIDLLQRSIAAELESEWIVVAGRQSSIMTRRESHSL